MPLKKKGSASGKRPSSRKKPGKSAHRKATKPLKTKEAPRKRTVSKRKGKASAPSRARPQTESLTSATAARALVAEQALQVFTGTVRINGNQSLLNGTLLIRAGVADFPSAMGAATQYLLNQGINDGDTISVSGISTTVQNGGRSINVIVMTSARRS